MSYTRIAASLSGREDLNLRPPAPKAGALPGCATPREKTEDEYNKGSCVFKLRSPEPPP